jgi:hypothetical protein
MKMSEALNSWSLFFIILFIIIVIFVGSYFIIGKWRNAPSTDKFFDSEWEYANKHFVWFPKLYYSDEQIMKRKKEFEVHKYHYYKKRIKELEL